MAKFSWACTRFHWMQNLTANAYCLTRRVKKNMIFQKHFWTFYLRQLYPHINNGYMYADRYNTCDLYIDLSCFIPINTTKSLISFPTVSLFLKLLIITPLDIHLNSFLKSPDVIFYPPRSDHTHTQLPLSFYVPINLNFDLHTLTTSQWNIRSPLTPPRYSLRHSPTIVDVFYTSLHPRRSQCLTQ